MIRTLADAPSIAAQHAFHPEPPEPGCVQFVIAPCCKRRVAADSVFDVRHVPGTIVSAGGIEPPRDPTGSATDAGGAWWPRPRRMDGRTRAFSPPAGRILTPCARTISARSRTWSRSWTMRRIARTPVRRRGRFWTRWCRRALTRTGGLRERSTGSC
jgi:hypothetical protein